MRVTAGLLRGYVPADVAPDVREVHRFGQEQVIEHVFVDAQDAEPVPVTVLLWAGPGRVQPAARNADARAGVDPQQRASRTA